jgi:hypothetical protein
MTELNKEPKMGYWYHHYGHAPGALRLDIAISEVPTGMHFDPSVVHLAVKSNQDSIERLAIHHPWIFANTYQACAGLVEIVDRRGKKEEAYTFGGSLTIKSRDTVTTCVLESPAPILEISSANPIMMMFIEEIEILFAKRKAVLLYESHNYEKLLVNADPLALYLACLKALVEKFDNFNHKEDPCILQFINFLHAEKKRLKDEGYEPDLSSDLEEIL